jgi:hypothetical protein
MTAGKTTCANYLAEKYGHEKFSFATPIKDLANAILNLNEVKEIERNRIVTEVIEPLLLDISRKRFSTYTNIRTLILDHIYPKYKGLKPSTEKTNHHRAMLQEIGESFRNTIDKYVWVNYLVNSSSGIKKVVVDDLRYLSELEGLTNASFTIVRIEVSPEIQKNRVNKIYGEITEDKFSHISEIELDNYPFKYIIDGSGSKEEMILSLDQVLRG